MLIRGSSLLQLEKGTLIGKESEPRTSQWVDGNLAFSLHSGERERRYLGSGYHKRYELKVAYL